MKNLTILLLGLLFSSCSTVHFVSPVPPGGESISSFPNELRGIFAADDDKIYVMDEYYIYQTISHKQIAEKNIQSHEKYIVVKDKVYNRERPLGGVPFERKDGAIHFIERSSDTSYINKDFILIKSSDLFYLNIIDDDKKDYIVYRFNVVPKGLKMESIDIGDDSEELLRELKKICEFVPIGEDGKEYRINPSASEFKKLIAQGIFNEEAELVRLKE